MQVNAGLWARELSVALGANDVPALASGTALQATPVAGTGPAPGFLLDVAALGGMYAGKITLVGTAAGLGVNNRGTLAADDGDWVLRTDGWLTNTGTIVASGNATAVVGGDIHNADSGLIAAGQNTSLDAAALRSDANAVLAAGLGADGQLNGTGTLDLNARQQIALQGQALAAGGLTAHTAGALVTDGAQLRAARIGLNAASLSNVGGEIAQSGGGTLTIHSTGTIDNTDGAILSDGGLAIHSAGTVTNLRGDMQAVGDARIDTAGEALDNTGGRITSQGALQVATGDITNRALGARAAQIGSSGDFTLTAAALSNGIDGATRSTLWSGQALNVRAQQLTNDGDIAGDTVLLQTQGDLTNSSTGTVSATQAIDIGADTFTNRGLVHANEAGGTSRVQLQATTVNNLGGAAIYGDRVAVAAHTLNNRPDAIDPVAPVIAARGQLDIGVQNLHNEDGALIYSGGDLRVGGGLDAATGYTTGAAQSVSNLSATIEAAGHMTIAADTLTNERRNANVHQATLLDQTAHLTMPSWWVNGQNEHGVAIEGTSNYSPHLFYLLDPASILSDEALVTPDGNVVHRIEVALDPADSIHFAASGAYAGNYGVRERVTVGAPTTAVLYVQQRTDNVTNPDQVPGSAHVFASSTASVTSWQRNTLNYSETYGRCSTNCTLLVVQPGYNDPQGLILRDTQRALTSTHAGLEVSRTARHTVVEDRLNVDAGAPAAIRAGGDMVLNVGTALVNRYADIQAGAGLDVQAGGASVTNEGQTLLRTHSFQVTSHTAAQGDFDWTAPEISEVVGHAGGTLSGAQQVSIAAQSLSNTDLARSTGLPANGLGFLGVSTPGPNDALSVPPSALLRPAAPDSAYLVETDPRFTHHSLWLGSDYLLSALASDPAALHKRLGDGFFEQKLVREQVAQLTGRRFLPGHTSDEAQFLALMEAGVAHAQAWNLIPGVALSAEQMAQLTTDLVWLVERVVVLPDGRRTSALVPQVYVRQIGDGEITPAGALIAGENVRLDIAQDIVNNGGMLAGDSVLLQAGRDITHIGGLLQGGHTLVASAGRDVSVISTTHGTSFESTYVNQRRTELARVGALQAGDADGAALIVNAGRDVNLQGASVGNASTTGSTTIQAGRDVHLQTVTVGSSDNTEYNAKNYQRHSQRQEIGTNVQALGDAQLRAGNDVVARAANVNALGDLSVQAGNDITLQAGRAVSESATSVHIQRKGMLSKKSTEEVKRSASDVAQGSGFSGANVVLQAGQDIQIQGSSVNAQDLLLLDAGRDVAIASEQNTESGSYFAETKKSGFNVSKQGVNHGKSTQSGSGTTSSSTQAGSSVSGGDVLIASGRDTRVSASTVVADELLSIDAGHNVTIAAGVNSRTRAQASDNKSKGVNLIASGLSESVTLMHDTRDGGDGSSASTTAAASTVGSLGGDVTITASSQYQQSGSDVLALAGDIHIEAQSVEITQTRETRSDTRQQNSKSTVLGATPRNALVDAIKSAKTTAETAQATSETGNNRVQAIGAAATALSAYNTAHQVAALVANPQSIASVTIDFNLGSSKSRSESTETADTGRASSVAAAGDVHITASGAGTDSDILIRGSDVSAGHDARLKAEGDVQLESGQDRSTLHSTNTSSGASIGVGVSFGASNGITFNASANQANGNAEGQDVVQRNTHIVAGNTARIESGADTTLAGASVNARTVRAEVGGSLNIESRQDTSTFQSDQQSSGWGVSLCIPPFCYGASSVSASGGAQNIESRFASVTEQSGFKAGDGGFQVNVQGDTTLTGGAITSADKAVQDNRNSFVTGGELTLSDVENRAEYQAEGYSVNLALAVAGAEARTPEQQKLAPAAPAKNEGSAGIGEDSGSASSTSQAAISGIAGNTEARTGDAESGIAPIFDQNRVQKEIDAQIRITAEFGKQASKAIGDYATKQLEEAGKLRDQATAETNPDRRAQLNAQADQLQADWGDNGTLRLLAHTVVGGLTGGGAGAAGASAGTLAAPAVADALTQAGIDGALASTLTALASTVAGAAAGGVSGSATAFNEVANNFLSHAESSLRLQLQSEQLACETDDCRQEKQQEIDRLNRLDLWRDAQIEQACESPASAACQSWTAAIRVAGASYQGQQGNLVDTAERSSVLNQAYKYQQAVDNPLLYGVGKGLLKLTPPGLLVGAVGAAAATVQSIVEHGAVQTAADALKGIAELPNDLRTRLNSSDPAVVGEALVDAIGLGFGGTAASAGAKRVALDALQRSKVRAALIKAEQEAVALARVENNIRADMPGYGGHAVRDFTPGTTHRAEMVNAGQVTDRDGLPRVDEIKAVSDSQQNLNQWDWTTQRPAWKEGTIVTDRVTAQPETYRMVLSEKQYSDISKALDDGDNNTAAKSLGSWATRDPINGIGDIRSKLAISSEWKGQQGAPVYVVEFTIRPGVGLREGTVGPMYDKHISSVLPGGGHQVQFMQNHPFASPSSFIINPSSLKELK
jgi:filamentous hemagglutinin